MSRVTCELDEDGDYIIVHMPYNEDAKAELKEQFQARWNPDDKCWSIVARDHDIKEVIAELKVHFGRVN